MRWRGRDSYYAHLRYAALLAKVYNLVRELRGKGHITIEWSNRKSVVLRVGRDWVVQGYGRGREAKLTSMLQQLEHERERRREAERKRLQEV